MPERYEKYSAREGISQSVAASWIDWGMPDRSIGKSFPSTSIIGLDDGTALDFEAITSSGGRGADKLVTDAGKIERGGEGDDKESLTVVIFAGDSFRGDNVDEVDPDGAFVDEVIVVDFDLVVGVEGVDAITLGRGGALEKEERLSKQLPKFNSRI